MHQKSHKERKANYTKNEKMKKKREKSFRSDENFVQFMKVLIILNHFSQLNLIAILTHFFTCKKKIVVQESVGEGTTANYALISVYRFNKRND